MAITQCTALMPGMLVEGVLGATYGTHLTAQVEAWKTCDWWDWDKMACHPAPDHEDVDLNPLTRKFMPVLGGSAWFDETWSKSLCSFRALPPDLDPHDYFEKRQQDLREEREKKNATIDPNTPDNSPGGQNQRGASRSKSIARYRNIQHLGQNETSSTRQTGEGGVAVERGRSRHRR